MSEVRNRPGVGVVDGSLYVMGGCSYPNHNAGYGLCNNGYGESLKTVEKYDAVNDRWICVADMQEPRVGLAVVAYNGLLYAIGGDKGHTVKAADVWGRREDEGSTALSSVEIYDPKTDTWTFLHTPMPTARQRAYAAVVTKINPYLHRWFI